MRLVAAACMVAAALAAGTPAARASSGPWYAAYERGLKAQAKEDWKGSVEHLVSAVEMRDKPQARARTYGLRFVNYFPYYYLALAHYNLGNNDAARRNLELSESYGESTRSEETREHIARMKAALGGGTKLTPVEVEQMIVPDATPPPPTPEGDVPWYVLYEAGVAYIESGDWASATNNLQRAVALEKTPRQYARTYGMWYVSYLPYYHLGFAAFNRSAYTMAVQYLETSEQYGVVKNFDDEYTHLKRLLSDARRRARAGHDVEAARITIESELTEAVKLYNEQDYPAAEARFEAILTADPYNSVAKAYMRRLREVTRGEEMRDQNYLMAGTHALFNGDYDEAVQLLESARAFHDGSADLHAYLGVAYASRHLSNDGKDRVDYDRAVEEFTRTLEIDPSYEIDRRAFPDGVIEIFREVKDKR